MPSRGERRLRRAARNDDPPEAALLIRPRLRIQVWKEKNVQMTSQLYMSMVKKPMRRVRVKKKFRGQNNEEISLQIWVKKVPKSLFFHEKIFFKGKNL